LFDEHLASAWEKVIQATSTPVLASDFEPLSVAAPDQSDSFKSDGEGLRSAAQELGRSSAPIFFSLSLHCRRLRILDL
jgi:hypothetical protein